MDKDKKTNYQFINRINELTLPEMTQSELFDELFSLSEFDRIKKASEISSRCKDIGLNKSVFEKLYMARDKAHKKMLRDMSHGFTDGAQNVLNFTDAPQLVCGMWVANDSGIFIETVLGRICACRHPIYPAEVYCNVVTNSYKIKLRYMLRGTWREVIVDKERISSANKIVELSNKGIQVTSENARHLVKFLNEVEALNADTIIEKKSTSKFGWIGNGFMPYANDMEFDNEESLRPLFDSITKTSGHNYEWLSEVLQIRQTKRFELQMYFAASLASVLVEPCGSLPFIISLFGGTGLGKTVALMYAASIWGDPSEGGYISDAKSTPVALEVKLDCLNSMPLMIDDIAQIQNQYEGKFSQLIYMWCSGRGKERSNVRLGLSKSGSWRNCIITNGERSLAAETSQGGAVNRIIEVELTQELFEDGAKTAKIFRYNYGHFGVMFVEALMNIQTEEGETWQTVVSREVEAILSDLKKMSKESGDEKEDKQLIPLAEILWCDRFCEKTFFHDGILIDTRQAFNVLKSRSEISEHKRCYEFIHEQLAIKNAHFLKSVDAESPQNIEPWGYYKEENDGKITKVVIFKTAFDNMLKDGGYQSRAFLGWAKSMNLLEFDDGRTTKVTKWHQKSVRAVILKVITDVDPETGFVEIPDNICDEIPFE